MTNLAIFVFDIDGRVVVYRDLDQAEGSLEAIDVQEGEYPIAYDEHGHSFNVQPYLDNARLTPTGTTDLDDLRHRLRQAYGPQHLAHRPHDYAEEALKR